MAEVFEAELVGELGFARKVAIKRMLGDAATDLDAARRFLDEAQIASRLHHANIVSVTDVGLLDGLPFQVLELVDGSDARQLQLAAGGTLPLAIALVLANDVAHALDHAHNALDAADLPLGIVHRDVKPSNVLVSWGGDVKLTDFGIALARDRAAKTEAGVVPGTTGFIAPEQRMRTQIDGRADVFALGLTLHALVTGYTPLQNVEAEIDLLAGKPLALDRALPADIAALIARAVAPDRRQRPSAGELAAALGEALVPRLARDARSELRDFLAPLRAKRAKPGALDQLLGFDVVPSGNASGGAQHYELRPTAIAHRAEELGGRTEPAPPPHARSKRAVWVGAALVVAAAGVASWRVLATRGGEARAIDAAPQPIAVVAIPVDAGAPSATPGDAAIAALPIDAAVEPPHHHRWPPPAPRIDAGVAAPPPGTGYVQVVGEANVGAKLFVDDRDTGKFAPNKLELAVGRHRLKIVRRDGGEATTAIEVTEYNTFANPLKPGM